MHIKTIYSDCIVVMLMSTKEWKYLLWINCILSTKADKIKTTTTKLEIRPVNAINLNTISIFFWCENLKAYKFKHQINRKRKLS